MTKTTARWNPTARQQQVLHLLREGAMTAKEIERSGFGIPQSSAISIVDALSRRGLVDVAAGTFVRGRYVRAYALTPTGLELEESLADAEGSE